MKRSALLKHFKQHDCKLLREGANHSIYWNPANMKTSSVPRHTEIGNNLTYKICKDLGIVKP